MSALLTDLYQLTMAAGYVREGKAAEIATFELFVRRLPARRNYLIAAGLQQAVSYLLELQFTAEDVAYLRGLPAFARTSEEFWEYLRAFRFTGDMDAMPEGTPFFANEPVLRVRAPLVEAQIPETYLLATIGFQSLIAAKASRVVRAAAGRSVVEMGTRRAHSPEAGVLAGRASYLGGCDGTSNVLCGMRYGVPVYGTAAHSWVQSFAREQDAFTSLQRLLGEGTIYLIDTYDVESAAHMVAKLGRPLWGVRIDSGDLVKLSQTVRAVLDGAGLQGAKILLSGDLNEDRITQLLQDGACVDSFGVGTDLATSADAPSVGAVYKLVQVEAQGERRLVTKLSTGKVTDPGGKQVVRLPDRDVVMTLDEAEGVSAGRPLLHPVLRAGRLVADLPELPHSRRHAAEALRALPKRCQGLPVAGQPYPVERSPGVRRLQEQAVRQKQSEVLR